MAQSSSIPSRQSRRAEPNADNEDPTPTSSTPTEIRTNRPYPSTDLTATRRQHDDPPAPPASSLTDQVVSSAVAGTVELLKLTGGLTLSASSKVLLPPLAVTRAVLLPHLYAATVDVLESSTPQKLQDWFRIAQSAISQFISVLTHTERGEEFRSRLLLVWGDFVDCISSDMTRQVLIDMTASSVKLGEALCTPEFQIFSEQIAILSCRFLEAISSGRVKQFVHDVHQLFSTACKLWADPQVIVALAEVTAYLCYALEMEDAILDGGFAQSDPQKKQKRQERRKERDKYQTTTYTDRTLLRNPNSTVEEAILSSIGGAPESSQDRQESCSLSTFDDNEETNNTRTGDSIKNLDIDNSASFDDVSIRQQLKQRDPTNGAQDLPSSTWAEKARKDVNVSYLKERIDQRSSSKRDLNDIENACSHQQKRTSTKTPKKRTLVQVEHPNRGENATTDQYTGQSFCQEREQSPKTAQSPSPKSDDETSTQYFYRVLDDILAQRRAQGVDQILDHEDAETLFDKPGHVTTKGLENRETVRQQINAIRAEFKKRDNIDATPYKSAFSLWRFLQQNRKIAWLLLFVFSLIGCTWTGLGCYGIYVIMVNSGVLNFRSMPFQQYGNGAMANAREELKPELAASSPHARNEIVIRVVREVVHINEQGHVLGRGSNNAELSEERLEQISECVASAV